jgi:hypothetical protein
MTAQPRPWTVGTNGPIEELEPNLWRVEGSVPKIPIKRVMTIAKRRDGRLVVYSAIALDEAGMQRVDAFGKVAFIVVPNEAHRLDASSWAVRYPEARVLAPKGGRAKIEQVVAVHGDLAELDEDPDVQVQPVGGTREREAMMIVRSGAHTSVVVSDSLFNMPHVKGFGGFLLRYVMGSSGGPKLSRLARLLFVKDKPAFAAQLDQLADLNPTRVIVAHHEVISEDPAGTLRKVAASLR